MQQPQQPATTADNATAAATAVPHTGVATATGTKAAGAAAGAGADQGADQGAGQGCLLQWQLLAKDVLLLQAFMAQVNR